MKLLKKILNVPIWIVAILVYFMSYKIDDLYVNEMFKRWAESDEADSEAYAVVNHHSNITCILVATIIVFVFWGVRRYFRKKFCKQT